MSASRPSPATIERVAFKTSRLAEFCSERELVAQTGHRSREWPLVILKELADNAIDACEDKELAPEIDISVSTETGEIVVADNGPGIPAEVVKDVLDYSSRVSSREAYVSPTRGAQGNALKTLVAMPFALHGNRGTVIVEAKGVRHTITFRVDQLRQAPVIDHQQTDIPNQKGTRVIIRWPELARLMPKRVFYKLPTTSAGSTRTSRSGSNGMAPSGSIGCHRIPPGKSGVPARQHLPTGMICSGYSVISRPMSPAIRTAATIGLFANLSARSAASPARQSKSSFSTIPG
ncbi:MAG: ATP-binding protein [Acidobacteria bacterium]|nr:ATP-binding protein [Acidobacteriota bacterium]